MDEMPPTTTSTRVAVECLMLWLERDRASAALHIAQLKQDPSEADELIVGVLNLSHSPAEARQGRGRDPLGPGEESWWWASGSPGGWPPSRRPWHTWI
jgi:hypothetical protein